MIRAKNLTGEELANLLVKHFLKIQTFAKHYRAPFVSGLDRNGKLYAYDYV